MTASEGRRNKHLIPIIFLGHGVDDVYVDVDLGRPARQVLSQAGFIVEWTECSGVDQESHWLKASEKINDIARFLQGLADT